MAYQADVHPSFHSMQCPRTLAPSYPRTLALSLSYSLTGMCNISHETFICVFTTQHNIPKLFPLTRHRMQKKVMHSHPDLPNGSQCEKKMSFGACSVCGH